MHEPFGKFLDGAVPDELKFYNSENTRSLPIAIVGVDDCRGAVDIKIVDYCAFIGGEL